MNIFNTKSDGCPDMSRTAQGAEYLAVVLLNSQESLLELCFVAIKSQQILGASGLLLCTNRPGSELTHKGYRRQQCDDRSGEWGQPDKSGAHGTKEDLTDAHSPVDTTAQRGLHGFQVEGVADVEEQIVVFHGGIPLLVTALAVLVLEGAEQAGKEPERCLCLSAY